MTNPAPTPSGGAALPALPLLLLFCGVNLVIGSGAFIISPLLAPLAEGLGVGIAGAGQAVTAYALSTAVLAPLALAATARWPRRRVMLAALALFAAGNAVCALAPGLAVLLAGRVLMGVGAVFVPVAAGIAVTLVEPARRGQALALVFLGMSLSYVVSLPLGAWLGFRYGWRVPIAGAAGLALLALAAIAWRVPRSLAAAGAEAGPQSNLGALLRQPEVLRVLATTLAYFTAIFCVFSYIGPVLQALVPMSSGQMSLTLMLFGCSGVAGTLIGGAANDRWGPRRSLWVQMSVLALTMALLPLTAGHWPALMAVLLAWGTAGFGMMAPQQSRLAALAPAQAPLLFSFNSSMLYFGTASGAAIGGALAPRLGFIHLPWVGLVAALLALLMLVASAWEGPQPAPSAPTA
ncbi:MFS transporter [Rubrivivax sp. A210]|uniref:MFS transporter n=1 Tax=Rubrivivax sp. A210 TaxID=2772301 RepID=UPI001F39F6EE|nr:MFS transporter [Rubrivivax sp. A210]